MFTKDSLLEKDAMSVRFIMLGFIMLVHMDAGQEKGRKTCTKQSFYSFQKPSLYNLGYLASKGGE